MLREARRYYAETRRVSARAGGKGRPAAALAATTSINMRSRSTRCTSFAACRTRRCWPRRGTTAPHVRKLMTEPAGKSVRAEAAGARAGDLAFARADRQLAALTAVEALRSYAASHMASCRSASTKLATRPCLRIPPRENHSNIAWRTAPPPSRTHSRPIR